MLAGRDYEELLEVIAGLNRKIQAIGEIGESELGHTRRDSENPAAPTPPPLRQALDRFMEACSEKVHMVTTTLNENIRERTTSRETEARSTAETQQQRSPPSPPPRTSAPARRQKQTGTSDWEMVGSVSFLYIYLLSRNHSPHKTESKAP